MGGELRCLPVGACSSSCSSPYGSWGSPQNLTVEILHPANGAVVNETGSEHLRIRVRVSATSGAGWSSVAGGIGGAVELLGSEMAAVERCAQLLVLHNGAAVHPDTAVLEADGVVGVSSGGARWPAGVATIEARKFSAACGTIEPESAAQAVAYVLVVDGDGPIPESVDCAAFLAASGATENAPPIEEVPATPRWRRQGACARAFADLFPSSWPAYRLLARIFEAEGMWEAASVHYSLAAGAAAADGAAAAWDVAALEGHFAEMHILAQSERDLRARACFWVSVAAPTNVTGGIERHPENQTQVVAATAGEDEEGDEGLYLSVVTVSRHDGTAFCQEPPDACLDRLQVSRPLSPSLPPVRYPLCPRRSVAATFFERTKVYLR